MRSRFAVAGAVALLATTLAVLRADTKDLDPKVPFNPFTNASAGDWAAFSCDFDEAGERVKFVLESQIQAVTAKEVVISRELKFFRKDTKNRVLPNLTFARHERPRATGLLDLVYVKLAPGEALTDAVVEKVKRTLGKAEVEGTAIALDSAKGADTWRTTLCVLEKIRRFPVFSLEVKKTGDKDAAITVKAVGFGARGKKEWGETADEFVATWREQHAEEMARMSPIALVLTATYDGSATREFLESWGERAKMASEYIWELTEGQMYVKQLTLGDNGGAADFTIVNTDSKMISEGVYAMTTGGTIKAPGKILGYTFFHELLHLRYDRPHCSECSQCIMSSDPTATRLCDDADHKQPPETSCWGAIRKQESGHNLRRLTRDGGELPKVPETKIVINKP
jgi:hypothetical protein